MDLSAPLDTGTDAKAASRFFRASCSRSHCSRILVDELPGLAINHAARFDQPHEGKQPVRLAMLLFLIGETGEPSEVSPVRRFRVALESTGQRTGNRRSDILGQAFTVVEPGLKIPGRRFDDRGGLETLGLHPVNCRLRQVVDQTQVVFTLRPDIDVPTAHVFKPQPGNGPQERFRVPRAREHPGVKPVRRARQPEQAKLENIRIHGLNLLPDNLARLTHCRFALHITAEEADFWTNKFSSVQICAAEIRADSCYVRNPTVGLLVSSRVGAVFVSRLPPRVSKQHHSILDL